MLMFGGVAAGGCTSFVSVGYSSVGYICLSAIVCERSRIGSRNSGGISRVESAVGRGET